VWCVWGVLYEPLKGTPSALKNSSEDTWVTDETSSRRKSTPGDASMRRSIQDLVLSIDPNIKIEPEVEDVRPGSLSPCPSPPPPKPQLTLIVPFLPSPVASFGYCRRVHRLGHQFWVSSRQTPRGRHVRSERLATPSRCVSRSLLFLGSTCNHVAPNPYLRSYDLSCPSLSL
jgi:hypothetical protein